MVEIFSPGLKSIRKTNDRKTHEKQITLQDARVNCRKCLELTIWARNNGFLKLAVYHSLKELSACVFEELNDIQSTQSPMNKLAIEIAGCAINSAITPAQKQHAYTEYLSLCELIGDEKNFYRVLDASSQYSSVSKLIRIWHDLGLYEKNHSWITSKKLRPEHAIEYIIKIVEEKTLRSMEKDINATADNIHSKYQSSALSDNTFTPFVILYYFVTDQEELGRKLLRDNKKKLRILLVSIALISKKEFRKAIDPLRNALKKDTNDASDKTKQNLKAQQN